MKLSSEDLEALLQANRILSSQLDDQDVVRSVMELATKVVRAEASALLMLDAAANELYFDVALGSAGEQVKQIRLKVGEGIAGWVAEHRAPLIVNDVAADARFTNRVDASTSFKTRAILAVPLVSKGELVGVVEAINKEKGQSFTDVDQEIFSAFASQAAVAIQNARLFSDIRREREKLSMVFGAMSEGVLLLDADARVILANPACARLLGSVADKAAGKTFVELLADFDSLPPLSSPWLFRRPFSRLEFKRNSGKDFYLSGLLRKLGGDGAPAANEGWIVILRDETESSLEGRLKQSFLSVISHKLKTPLTTIIGYAPALVENNDNMTEFQKKAVSAVATQGEHLAGLVDKLLRFTIVESESIARNPKAVSLEDIVSEALDALESAREATGTVVTVDASVAAAPMVNVERLLTIEAVKNVIENGFKFNDKAARELRVSAEVSGTSAVLSVKDNGVGIPPEEQGKIFQKFYQVENHFTGQVPGAGLGLALTRKVVDSMGGGIRVESTIGEGTTVFLTFPLHQKESA